MYLYDIKVALSHPDGVHSVTGSHKGEVSVWSIATGEPVSCFKHDTRDLLQTLTVSPDGLFVISGYFDGTIAISAIKTGKLIQEYKQNNGSVYACKLK